MSFYYAIFEEGGIPMAGRKPKPTALKKPEGNPGKRKLNTKEPMPGKGMPDYPKWLLPEAKKEWEPVGGGFYIESILSFSLLLCCRYL